MCLCPKKNSEETEKIIKTWCPFKPYFLKFFDKTKNV